MAAAGAAGGVPSLAMAPLQCANDSEKGHQTEDEVMG